MRSAAWSAVSSTLHAFAGFAEQRRDLLADGAKAGGGGACVFGHQLRQRLAAFADKVLERVDMAAQRRGERRAARGDVVAALAEGLGDAREAGVERAVDALGLTFDL